MLVPTSPSLFFKGRTGDPRLGEIVLPCTNTQQLSDSSIVIMGSPDDLGVIANRGRPGAAGGPDAIRAALFKMTTAFDIRNVKIPDLWDCGNIQTTANLEDNHQAAKEASHDIALRGSTMIALGGGHDYAAPHYLGWAAGVQKTAKGRLSFGLINVDPHLDVRELEDGKANSGTPFRQILESKVLVGTNFVEFGARLGRNAVSHFEYCRKNKVRIRLLDDLRTEGSIIKAFNRELGHITKTCTQVGLTIDMDSCSELEGVSAAPVIGFSAWELCQFAYLAGGSPRVKFLELAEVAPALDPTGRAARIAAEVIFYFLKGRIEICKV